MGVPGGLFARTRNGRFHQPPAAAALDDTQGSVLKIVARTCDGTASGTGFVLDDSTVVTNAHVVDDAASLSMTTQSGTKATVSVATRDTLADLAAVTTHDRLPPALPLGGDPTPGVIWCVHSRWWDWSWSPDGVAKDYQDF